MRRLFAFVVVFFSLSGFAWAVPSTTVQPIVRNLNQGHADDALQQLSIVLSKSPNDAEALNLRCRVYYSEELWDQAISDCEAAVKADPGNSDYHLWLGRAYGQKASTASLVAAYKLARRVTAEFQQAVQLNPHNVQALDALGQFDVDAPTVVGGGIARAEKVVDQLQVFNISAAMTLQARIAEARKDWATAEQEYEAAIPRAAQPARAWMELASFYLRRKRYDDMVAAARRGATLATSKGPALVNGAADLARARRDPQTAIQWLREYLNSQNKSEDAPAFAVHAQLAQLLESEGDAAGAQQQLAKAHALASGYHIPASIASAKAGL